MKSNIIKVTSQGEGINEALTMTEGLAQACGLEKKQSLQLRLLSEELFRLLSRMGCIFRHGPIWHRNIVPEI